MTDANLDGEPGWDSLAPYWESIGIRSFVSSDTDGDRLRVRYFDADGQTWARAWFGPGAEGPPGHVHGGALAALMDEAMGMAVLVTGRLAVAARIEVDFRSMVSLGETVTVELTLGEAAGAKVPVRGVMRRSDGRTACESTGLFVEIGIDGMGEAATRAGL